MKRKIYVIIPVSLCAVILGCFGIYMGLKHYYKDSFLPNTWINGVYCTGKSVSEINDIIVKNTILPEIVVEDKLGERVVISPKEIDLKVDYLQEIQSIQNSVQTNHWLNDFQKEKKFRIDNGSYSWNKIQLDDRLAITDIYQNEMGKDYGCQVLYDPGNGFYLYDGNKQRMNLQDADSYIQKCLKNGIFTISLSDGNCYEDLPDSEEDVCQRELWEQLDVYFAKHKLTYDMGAEKIVIEKKILSDFVMSEDSQTVSLDENGKLLIQENAVIAWVDELTESYDTVNTTREFQSTRGDLISVSYVTYGTKLDAAKEKKFLLEQMLGEEILPENRIHVPVYVKEGYTRGKDDLGNTYIEVDMTTQHMYYYQNGELKLDTDVVTGNIGRRMGTPEGINFVYGKQKNRVLIGPNYATPVKFWVPVKGHVGIHDASWRNEFGGEIYKTNGSHGCINTPTEKMAELYDMVEIGTPVVMFY